MMFLSVLALATLAYWLVMTVVSIRGLRLIPTLQAVEMPLEQEPKVSVIVAAKNEEASIARTMRHLLQQNYSNYEVIAINDRSDDRTGEQMEEVRRWAEAEGITVPLQVVHVESLPDGWLGKNHALYHGYLQSRGEILLFTDADVVFQPHVIRSAIAYQQAERVDFVTMIPAMIAHGFWLRAFVHYFLFSLSLLIRPWRSNLDHQHKDGFGIGAFNMLTRRAYEQIGTHESISMRPDDDLQLGLRVKSARLRMRIVTAVEHLQVEWYPTLREAIRGLEKNTFAGMDYKLSMLAFAVFGQLAAFCFPFVAALVLTGWLGQVYLVTVLLIVFLYLKYTRTMTVYAGVQAIAIPLTTLLFSYIIIRSAYLTLKQGGIYWRGTFYSLAELKRMKQK